MLHLEVNPTEASLLYSEVWRDLQEARSVTFLLDSWSLVSPLICPRVVPPPAARERSFIHNAVIPHFQWQWQHTHTSNHSNTHFCTVSVLWQHGHCMSYLVNWKPLGIKSFPQFSLESHKNDVKLPNDPYFLTLQKCQQFGFKSGFFFTVLSVSWWKILWSGWIQLNLFQPKSTYFT